MNKNLSFPLFTLKYTAFILTSVFLLFIWDIDWYYLPTPPLGQDMTQGQFLGGVQ